MPTLSTYDNRTDPIFKGTTPTNTVNLSLTTLCSMHCPHCSVAVPAVKGTLLGRHATLEEIMRDAKLMQPMRRVHLTGGEPTIHPHFRVIARAVRKWFRADYVTIETNGVKFKHFQDVFLQEFDRVFITWYEGDAIYPGSPDNTKIIDYAQEILGPIRLIVEKPIRHERSHEINIRLYGKEEPCSKWFDPGLPCGWYLGQLYACCVTWGINPSWGIPVTENWREEIVKLPKGCGACIYRGT